MRDPVHLIPIPSGKMYWDTPLPYHLATEPKRTQKIWYIVPDMKIKFQTSAGGIVYKKEGKKLLWLIVQHSQHRGWTFPKGLVGDKDRGENNQTAALREVEEEGGVKVRIVDPQPIVAPYAFRLDGFLIKKTVYYYLMEYISGNPDDHDWEVSEAKFITEEEMRKKLSFKSDKEAFEQILKKMSG